MVGSGNGPADQQSIAVQNGVCLQFKNLTKATITTRQILPPNMEDLSCQLAFQKYWYYILSLFCPSFYVGRSVKQTFMLLTTVNLQ